MATTRYFGKIKATSFSNGDVELEGFDPRLRLRSTVSLDPEEIRLLAEFLSEKADKAKAKG